MAEPVRRAPATLASTLPPAQLGPSPVPDGVHHSLLRTAAGETAAAHRAGRAAMALAPTRAASGRTIRARTGTAGSSSTPMLRATTAHAHRPRVIPIGR